MALTKAGIVEAVMKETGFTNSKSCQIVEELLALMKTTLASGEDLLVSGFGKFSVRDKRQRRGRNPATGSDMTLRPRRVVTFKGAGNLRCRINGTGKE